MAGEKVVARLDSLGLRSTSGCVADRLTMESAASGTASVCANSSRAWLSAADRLNATLQTSAAATASAFKMSFAVCGRLLEVADGSFGAIESPVTPRRDVGAVSCSWRIKLRTRNTLTRLHVYVESYTRHDGRTDTAQQLTVSRTLGGATTVLATFRASTTAPQAISVGSDEFEAVVVSYTSYADAPAAQFRLTYLTCGFERIETSDSAHAVTVFMPQFRFPRVTNFACVWRVTSPSSHWPRLIDAVAAQVDAASCPTAAGAAAADQRSMCSSAGGPASHRFENTTTINYTCNVTHSAGFRITAKTHGDFDRQFNVGNDTMTLNSSNFYTGYSGSSLEFGWSLKSLYGKRLKITFTDVNIYQTETCLSYYIKLRDGPNSEDRMLSNLCGNVAGPLTWISTKSEALIDVDMKRGNRFLVNITPTGEAAPADAPSTGPVTPTAAPAIVYRYSGFTRKFEYDGVCSHIYEEGNDHCKVEFFTRKCLNDSGTEVPASNCEKQGLGLAYRTDRSIEGTTWEALAGGTKCHTALGVPSGYLVMLNEKGTRFCSCLDGFVNFNPQRLDVCIRENKCALPNSNCRINGKFRPGTVNCTSIAQDPGYRCVCKNKIGRTIRASICPNIKWCDDKCKGTGETCVEEEEHGTGRCECTGQYYRNDIMEACCARPAVQVNVTGRPAYLLPSGAKLLHQHHGRLNPKPGVGQNHFRFPFIIFKDMDVAFGNTTINAIYVTSSGAVGFLVLPLPLLRWYNGIYEAAYNHTCRRIGPLDASASHFGKLDRLCDLVENFVGPKNMSEVHLHYKALDPAQDSIGKIQLEGVLHPYWMKISYHQKKNTQTSISVYEIEDDVSSPRFLLSQLPGANIVKRFTKTIVIKVDSLVPDVPVSGGGGGGKDQVLSFHLVIGTTYQRTVAFAVFDECARLPKSKTREVFSGFWSRPRSVHRKASVNLRNHDTHEVEARLGERFGSTANPRGILTFALSDERGRNYHPGMACERWLGVNPCADRSCGAQASARIWCPTDDEHIHFDFAEVSVDGLPRHVACYQPLTGQFEWDGFAPMCCYLRRNRWSSGHSWQSGPYATFVYGPGEAALSSGVPVNMVVKGRADEDKAAFAEQLEAYRACCLGREHGAQCGRFTRARPFTRALLVRTAGGWRGDVHLASLDGLLFTFNGVGCFDLVRGRRRAAGTEVALEVAAIFQNSSTAPRASFTQAVAGRCLVNGSAGDLVQVTLNATSRDIDISVNRSPLAASAALNSSRGLRTPGGVVVRRSDAWVSLVFPCGLTLRARVAWPGLTLAIVLDTAFRGRTQGLLGNFNGDPEDDLRSRDGATTLPANATDRALFPVASTWRCNCSVAAESLVAVSGPACRPSAAAFRPQFADEALPAVPGPARRRMEAECGGSVSCLFDYAATNDSAFARAVAADEAAGKALKRSEENSAPKLAPEGLVLRIVAGRPGSHRVSASDPDANDTARLAVNASAAWIDVRQVDDSSAELRWSAAPFDAGRLAVTAAATDRVNKSTVRAVSVLYCQCRNNATCRWPDASNVSALAPFVDVACNCSRGWAGRHCQHDEDGCRNHPCRTACTDVPVANVTAAPGDPEFVCAPCPAGFSGDGRRCDDIDECANGTADCQQLCNNTAGSYVCACRSGYVAAGKRCLDVDECSTGVARCPRESSCVNTNGSYACRCSAGYTAVGSECGDVNECWSDPNPCAAVNNSYCVNAIGSYACACNRGFEKDTSGDCVAVDLCQPISRCSQRCVSEPPATRCACVDGFHLAKDWKTCLPNRNCSAAETSRCRGGQCAKKSDGSTACACSPSDTRVSLADGSQQCRSIDECARNETNKCTPRGVAICADHSRGYRCQCPAGYALASDQLQCVDVDECVLGSHKCDLTNGRCLNTVGSYSCLCNAGFAQRVNATGHFVCRDIDECAAHNHTCNKDLATCTNLPGSYRCRCRPGFSGDGRTCVDVDECALPSLNACDENHGVCVNSAGNYSCSCRRGFQLGPDGRTCSDVDECRLGRARTGCFNDSLCQNSLGSFQCLCPPGTTIEADGKSCAVTTKCPATADCGSATCYVASGAVRCSCPPGFEYHAANKTCRDVDECSSSSGSKLCPAANKVRCVNTVGSYRCVCEKPRYQRLLADGNSCADVDECANGTLVAATCRSDGRELCRDKEDGFDCVCASGFERTTAGAACTDVNECISGAARCQSGATCENIAGGYVCLCSRGFVGRGTTCIDVDECAVKNGGCAQNCTNTDGSYRCTCRAGYRANGRLCVDVDECAVNNGNCTQNCTNTVGSFRCSCSAGYDLASDGRSCRARTQCPADYGCSHLCSAASGSPVCACPFNFRLRADAKTCEALSRDGAWAAWGAWTACSATCGGGTRQRQRTCTAPAPLGSGRTCTAIGGLAALTEACATARCRSVSAEGRQQALSVGIRFGSALTAAAVQRGVIPALRSAAAEVVTAACNIDFAACCARASGRWRRKSPDVVLAFVTAADILLPSGFSLAGSKLELSLVVSPLASNALCQDVVAVTRRRRSAPAESYLPAHLVQSALSSAASRARLTEAVRQSLQGIGVNVSVTIESIAVAPTSTTPAPTSEPIPNPERNTIVVIAVVSCIIVVLSAVVGVLCYKKVQFKKKQAPNDAMEDGDTFFVQSSRRPTLAPLMGHEGPCDVSQVALSPLHPSRPATSSSEGESRSPNFTDWSIFSAEKPPRSAADAAPSRAGNPYDAGFDDEELSPFDAGAAPSSGRDGGNRSSTAGAAVSPFGPQPLPLWTTRLARAEDRS